MKRRYPTSLALLLGLGACGSGQQDGVGGVSASEASALNEAAASLDARTGAAMPRPNLNPAAAAAARVDRDRPDSAGTSGDRTAP
ncbi:hypothetical protein PMI04_005555 [Sphingobium sp. AP49]|uniref:hypothetical protein n=1 Tax=Sphingobium sp. AP49 TaxID=1144307 RepID=UPI00026ED783|nr:hypothetical protein [Sphingobium sp. AP49]WHO40059.1 hypothetical protein PMI04_005555 [Sphingobium sp. AP49]